MGDGWTSTCPFLFGTPTISPLKSHKVTIHVGRDTYRFEFTPDQPSCFGGFVFATATFTPYPGTSGTLVPDGSPSLSTATSITYLTEGGFGSGPVYSPAGYTLTTRDQWQIHFNGQRVMDKMVDPAGNEVVFDAAGIHHGPNDAATYVRDSAGRITDLALADGSVRGYSYDGNGDLITATDFEGDVFVHEYDDQHQLLGVYSPTGRPIARHEYDAAGRLTAIVDGRGQKILVTPSDGASPEVFTDRKGYVWINHHDAAGNVTKTVDPLGHVVTQTFDARHNRLSRTDELGHTTTFEYDVHDQLTKVTDPIGRVVQYTYDTAGNLLSRTDPDGQTATFAYDAEGRLTQQITPKST